MLTKQQLNLLNFLHDYMEEHSISPTFDEMKAALDLKSKSGIHRLISGLEERGFIKRHENRARAIEILRHPQDMNTRLVKEEDVEFKPSNDDLVSVPLYGKIAAGTPIEAIATEQNMVDVPMGFLGSSECYALEIEGDSMMKAGIMDGDIVLIERCNTASDGDIIVALVDGEEATLKRLRREIGKVILQPENDSYQPIMLDAARVQIQGKLKTLYRHY
jgi:repressor LexA